MKNVFTLADLEEKADKNRRRMLSRQKERYDFAKELGFSGIEAGVLQHKDRETIRRLAKEKDEALSP